MLTEVMLLVFDKRRFDRAEAAALILILFLRDC